MATTRRPHQIVVGFDLTELGERVVEEALDVARRHFPAELHVITVAVPYADRLALPGENRTFTDEEARTEVRQRVGAVVERYQHAHGWAGLERIPVYVVTGMPAHDAGHTIADLGQALEANVIIVGTHGRTGLSRVLLGSVAAEVVQHATTSVLVVRPSDFLHGEKVPSVEPPLDPGQPHLKPFEHRRTYHYVDKVAPWTSRTMPVS